MGLLLQAVFFKVLPKELVDSQAEMKGNIWNLEMLGWKDVLISETIKVELKNS